MTSIKAKLTAVLASVVLAASMAVPAFAYEQVEDTVSYGHGYSDPGYLVIHETANPGASAYNHTLLWSRDDTYAVHYVMELDGSVVYHTVPDWALCWHVGSGNYATVGIELAHATNFGDFSAQWDNAVAWAGDYLNSRGWGIDRLLSHNDCAWIWGGTDHTDPTGYFAEYGRSWNQFKQDITPISAVTRRPALATRPTPTGIPTTRSRGGHHIRRVHRPPAAGGCRRWWTTPTPAGLGIRSRATATIPSAGSLSTCPAGTRFAPEASGWLDPVYGYDKSDLMWGCAGDGSPITAVRCCYETQDPNRTGWLVAELQRRRLAVDAAT